MMRSNAEEAKTSAGSDLSRDILLSWESGPLESMSIPGPLGSSALHLRSAFAASPATSVLLHALLLVAVAGPARRVRAPLTGGLPPSLNIVFVTNSPVVMRRAVGYLFAPVTVATQNTLQTGSFEDPERREENLAQLKLQWLHAQDIVTGLPSASASKTGLPSNPEAAADLEAAQAELCRQAAAANQEMLREKISRLQYRIRPEIVAEGLDANELLVADALSFDSAVLSLDCDGGILGFLNGAPAPKARQLARYFDASWTGKMGPGSHRGTSSQVSNLWVTSPELLTQVGASEALGETATLDTFLFVESNDLAVNSTATANQGLEAWLRLTNFVFSRRRDGHVDDHWLSEEGTKLFYDFVNEVNRLWPKLPPTCKAFGLRWPDLALKLSLLLHVGGHDPRPPEDIKAPAKSPAQPQPPPVEISVETVQTAVQLTKILVARHVRLVERLKEPGQPNDDPAVARMVKKIRLKEPVTRGTLYRSFSKQSRSLHDPVLGRAIELGLVREDGCFLYATKPSSGSQHPQSSSNCSVTDLDGIQQNNTREEVS